MKRELLEFDHNYSLHKIYKIFFNLLHKISKKAMEVKWLVYFVCSIYFHGNRQFNYMYSEKMLCFASIEQNEQADLKYIE